MKKLSREQMKLVMGGMNTLPIDDGDLPACFVKCSDSVNGVACGGKTECQCETACVYCKKK